MTRSFAPPSVLLLDDGELDTVDRTLKRLGADYVRVNGARIPEKLEQPRDLLITSGKHTLAMTELERAGATADPVWVCFNNQDFLPLRERMRGLGVNFLVHSSLDIESLRLFLLQMLYRGSERRASNRLPLASDASLVLNDLEKAVRLLELSTGSCRFLSPEQVPMDSSMVLRLPESLSGGDCFELRGTSVRSSLCQTRGGGVGYSVVLRYDDLEAESRAALDKLLRGEQISARVSPLAGAQENEAPGRAEPAEVEAEAQERRGSNRRVYERRVELLEPCDSNTDTSGLGCDLSLDGVRVRGGPELEPGATVTLALYGGRREEPLVIKSFVVRSGEDGEVTFRFEELSADQERRLEKLAIGLGRLESLEGDGPVVVTKLVGNA